MKPQISFLPLLLLPLSGRWRALAWGSALVALAAAAPLAFAGSAGLLADLRSAQQLYLANEANLPAKLVGAANLLARVGLQPPGLVLPLSGAALVVLLHRLVRAAQARSPADGRLLGLAAPFVVTGFFSQLHLYDTAVYALPIAALAVLSAPLAILLAPPLVLAARPQLATQPLSKLGILLDSDSARTVASVAALVSVVALALALRRAARGRSRESG
jgi:hypothetical protein